MFKNVAVEDETSAKLPFIFIVGMRALRGEPDMAVRLPLNLFAVALRCRCLLPGGPADDNGGLLVCDPKRPVFGVLGVDVLLFMSGFIGAVATGALRVDMATGRSAPFDEQVRMCTCCHMGHSDMMMR